MTYFDPHSSPRRIVQRFACLAGLTAVLAVPSTALGQQSIEYTPAEASQLLDRVLVYVGGEQVNRTDPDEDLSHIGPIGVERCKELTDNAPDRPVEFVFQYKTGGSGTPGLIDEEDYYLIDTPYFRQDALECTPGGDGTMSSRADCEKITADGNEIIIDSPSGGERVTVQWKTLREEFDRTIGPTETCEFPDDPPRGGGGQMNGDAGMDSGMGADIETGMGNETGTEAGMGDADGGNGNSSWASAPDVPAPKTNDHIYAIRLFLTNLNNTSSDNYRTGDAALRLDRTRPSGPVNARAAATESVLKVRFDTPQVRKEIESYHVFYSDQSIPSFEQAAPEDLVDNPNITRRLLRGDADDVSGTITEQITGLGKNQGDRLYVGIATRDEARNYSPLAILNRPVEIQKSIDFWERYLSDGGLEEGGFGCRAVGGSPVAPSVLVGLIALVGLRRRWR